MDKITKMYFVILHYKTINETIDCVNDVISLKGEKEIIIVDNGSNDGSYEKLIVLFSGKENIQLIKSNTNLGYANGNNLGIDAIPDKTNVLVTICNNDLRFDNDTFISVVNNTYHENHFAVLGPNITSTDGIIHENPSINEVIGHNALNRELKRFAFIGKLNHVGLVNIGRLVNYLYSVKSNKRLDWRIQVTTLSKKIKVHGSCLVLAPEFFDVYKGLYDGTFLFQEENILSDMCIDKSLLIVYEPRAKVIHLGSRSLKTKHSDWRERFTFYIDECFKSLSNYRKWKDNQI